MPITFPQFCALKHGDVVFWHTKDHGYYRTVLLGPADKEKFDPLPTHNFVILTIRRRSWTGRVDTAYNYCDMANKISPTKLREENLVSWEEVATLQERGFKPAKGFLRVIRDEVNSQLRNPRLTCSTQWQRAMLRRLKQLKSAC